MRITPGQQRIKIPKPCMSPSALYRFSLDVVEGMKNLRDRQYFAPPQRPSFKEICPLKPFLQGESGLWYLWISPGISGNTIPTFAASPVGPDNTQPVSAPTQLWLKVTWEPVSRYDEDLEIYWMASGGTLISSEFIFDEAYPVDTAANVDQATGSKTNGIYHFLWANIQDIEGRAVIVENRCGNHSFSFCPSTLSIVFDSVTIYLPY